MPGRRRRTTGMREGVRNFMRTAMRNGLHGISGATMGAGVVALALNTACYSFDARPLRELSGGQHVTVMLNDTGREALAATLGDSIASAAGDFVSNDVAGIHMTVNDVQFLSGISSPRSGVAVTIPRAAFDSVTTKKLSVATTSWLVLGIVAGVVALIKSINVNPSGSPTGTGQQPPPTSNQ